MDMSIIEMPAWIGRYLLTLKITDILDIAIMAFVLYKVMALAQSTKAASLLKGLLVFMAALFISSILNLNGINFILSGMVDMGVLALIILFQPELRRILEQMGSRRFMAFLTRAADGNVIEKTILQTVQACSDMSQTRTGALSTRPKEIPSI